MNNKITLMWILTGICLLLTIIFWFLMKGQEISYEEVMVTVTDTSSREVVNKKTHNKTTFYTVMVKYEGKEYELHNVHSLTGYYKGKSVKALLSNNKLYANVEGIKTSSPVAIIYFVFLFGTFGMLMLSATYTSKEKQKNKEKLGGE